ncbi:MAG: GNAT family N-acetyltransferase [Phenylobacterium sp.]|uniref:GNAT family N-acetyltransferase n=1 Tax=Phenylobacterium sp. TaxID=1871053 RepID=UPI0039193BE4
MTPGPEFRFGPAGPEDLERLATLRAAAMRESLERIGRFDPDRAYRRMVDQYRPEHTRLIHTDDRLAGCVAMGPGTAGALRLEHFYLEPAIQGRGLGSAVLHALLAEADAAGTAVELSVVHESPAHRFYQRFGFVETGRDATDIYYRRAPSAPRPG